MFMFYFLIVYRRTKETDHQDKQHDENTKIITNTIFIESFKLKQQEEKKEKGSSCSKSIQTETSS